jgi:uncharacterized protein YegL
MMDISGTMKRMMFNKLNKPLEEVSSKLKTENDTNKRKIV